MGTTTTGNITVTSGYAGEVLETLLVRATTQNELVRGGHVRLVPNVAKKYTLPRVRIGKVLQKRKEQPQSTDSKGNIAVDEKTLEPLEFMAYTEFNPRAFENFWRPFQPTGALVFRELPSNVQNLLLAELAKVVDFELGEHMLIGEAGTGVDQFFDGLLTVIRNDSDTVEVPSAVALTASNIIEKMRAVSKLIPKAIRRHPNLKLFMSMDDFDLYDDVITSSVKGKGWDDINLARFKGITIVPLAAMPKDVMFCTVGNMDMTTNLWAGVDYVNDAEAILIDKVTNAGEKYFFKMLMKAATQIAFGEDVVLYDAVTVEP